MDPEKLIDYWRNSLADADLRQPSFKELEEVELEAVEKGELSPELYEIFAKRAKEIRDQAPKGRSGSATDWEKELPVPVSITPLGLCPAFEHGAQRRPAPRAKIYTPFWIAARLDKEGRLLPDPERGAWFVRAHLAPTAGRQPVLGELTDFDRGLAQISDPEEARSWHDTWSWAEELFESVTESSFEGFTLEGHETLPPRIVFGKSNRGIHRSILALYDALREEDELPPLLSPLARGAETSRPAPGADVDDPELPRRHLGQMSGAFPLAPSQRQAVHAFAGLREGEILAVNGPPGTGKTTLLQSIVASAWVEAALDAESEGPPIIVACSSNNQAITNILDSFDRVVQGAPEDPWASRWLPGVDSYGLYLPSYTKSTSIRRQMAVPGRPGWEGLPATMENEDYLDDAEKLFLDKARKAFDEPPEDVEEAVDKLRGRLEETHAKLRGLIEAANLAKTLGRHLDDVDGDSVETKLAAHKKRLKDDKRTIETLRREAHEAADNATFFEILLAPFFSAFAHRMRDRVELPFRRRGYPPPDLSDLRLVPSIETACDAFLAERDAELRRIERWHEWLAFLRQGTEALTTWEAIDGVTPEDVLAEPDRILDLLDPTLRYRLFLHAARLWEGRWLLEMRRLLDAKEYLHHQGRQSCLRRLRRFAMLTPCMVSTFHTAPNVFDHFRKWRPGEPQPKGSSKYGTPWPLFGDIDVLIVDEAGQTSPEVGAATFALAKRALVVGDVHQIPPIWNITPALDAAHHAHAGLPMPDPERETDRAHRASEGSVMHLARRAAAIRSSGEPGLFLEEHRRSVPEVIEYCNELVYGRRLEPKRASIPDAERPLPAWGFAHVVEAASQRGGSRVNEGEAKAIVRWLAERRDELEAAYGVSLREAVGIVTPFAAQKWALRRALGKAKLGGVEAGTVHTFQGAERKVILFSPVYNYDGDSSYFFDVDPSMLNVAVSRAADSFLVLGDMRLLKPGNDGRPSSLLAKYLFASEDNEISGVENAPHIPPEPRSGADRLASLADHRATLARAFEEARERLLIVSPYLSDRALRDDGIPERITAARHRGVDVVVAYNRQIKKEPRVKRALALFQEIGFEPTPLSRIHNKTLAVDDRWMVEGSFNWLSAIREKGHAWQNRERSFLLERGDVPQFIRDAWKEVRRDPAG